MFKRRAFKGWMETNSRQKACAAPERFWKFPPPARRHLSGDFLYAIVFMEKPEHVWIVAVMHMKRRPGYWRGRLA